MITATSRAAQLETNWQKLWRDAIRDPRELLELLELPEMANRLATDAMRGFPLRVPRGFAARMRKGDANDPLLRQVLPLDREDRPAAGFTFDAVGDMAARTAPGVLQKYAGRALLIATGSCAIHCRYCFRRHFPYAEETAAADRWSQTLRQLALDHSIDEVILSGGDPLSLSNARLAELLDRLPEFPHLRTLRIHTRLPIVLPERIDTGLVALLTRLPLRKVMVVHANHAHEFDASVDAALARLQRLGITLLNQSVLLRGVNHTVDALIGLSQRSFAAGVLPYYLHQLDRVAGTAHFAVSDRRAQSLHREVRARLPGYLVPRLVREIAGEPGKSPVGVATW